MRPDERQKSADEQRERAGVGAVVNARRIGVRVEQQDHLKGRQHDEHDDAFLHRRAFDASFHADEQGDWPDEVELLFDRERPIMRQRGRRSECLEIRDIVEDLPPVVEEEQRRQDIRPHLREQGMVEDRAQQRRSEHGEHNGGNDAAHAAQPEVRQADRAAVVVFLEKQAGDQITRQHEEHRDAEKAARCPSEVHVVCDND